MLGFWMALVPLGAGYFILSILEIKKMKNGITAKNTVHMSYAMCSGYILLWAAFQLIAVPIIIKGGDFLQIEWCFEVFSLTAAIAGMLLFLLHLKHGLWKELAFLGKETLKIRKSREELLTLFLWGIFLAGLLFQMVQAYRLAYADGDDAFYIPLSVSVGGGSMYTSSPYTGDSMELNLRYALAPFPVWVAFIAKKCSVNVAVAAHSLMPLVLIPVTYLLYLEMGRRLCVNVLPDERKGQSRKETLLPLFMIFVTLLQIFGNYSIYPVSTFLLTRTRQGKAAIGNVILPFLVLILYKMGEEIKEQGKAGRDNVLWLAAAMTAGCFCSVLGGFLCGILVMVTVFLICILYRKPSVLAQGLLGCLPGAVYALLYLKF